MTYEEYLESIQNSISSLDPQMDAVWEARDGNKSQDTNFVNRTYEVQKTRDALDAEMSRMMLDAPNWQMYQATVDDLHSQYQSGVNELYEQI